MSHIKHTSGPWSVPHFAEPAVNCQCRYVLTDDMLGAVCTVHASGEGADWQAHGDNPKFAEAVANAHLIASAPDMFAALIAQDKAAKANIQYQRVLAKGDASERDVAQGWLKTVKLEAVAKKLRRAALRKAYGGTAS